MTKLRLTRETIVLIKDYLYTLEVTSLRFDWEEAGDAVSRIWELAGGLAETLADKNFPQGSLVV